MSTKCKCKIKSKSLCKGMWVTDSALVDCTANTTLERVLDCTANTTLGTVIDCTANTTLGKVNVRQQGVW